MLHVSNNVSFVVGKRKDGSAKASLMGPAAPSSPTRFSILGGFVPHPLEIKPPGVSKENGCDLATGRISVDDTDWYW